MPISTDHVPEDIVFLFKRGRLERLGAGADGPTEFLYGYVELKNSGVPVDLVDESAFGFGESMPPGWTVLSLISTAVFGVHAWAVHRLARGLHLFSSAHTVVAVNNAYGVALAYLKARGRLRPAVVFLAMGLVDDAPRPLVRRAYARILRHVTLATISRPECEHLAAILPSVSVHYVPFGVDHRFWTPARVSVHGDYVLSVGNDPHRDYDTLIRAWRPDFPELRIVTRLPVPEERPSNIEVIVGDWRTQRLSDGALRDMVRGSRFVVVPVVDTMQPSGQSACLQAMACGKAVVLSDIAGLWDRGLMRDGESCILFPPGDAEALGRSVHELLDNPDRAQAIGRAARRTVEEHLNVDAMAQAVRELCLETQAPGGRAVSGSRYGPGYLSHERWVSYVHQISALADIAPRSVLEVGVGPGVKATMVAATFPGCTYVGVDIEGTLAPDVRADVRALPFDDGWFDAAFCCQVLEHIPYEDFLTGLGELKRVTRRRVVISLPDVRPFLYLRARPPASWRYLPWLWRGFSLPALPPREHNFEAHGQHHWEIGKRGYPLRRIVGDIRSLGWAGVRNFRMIERHYWHFFVLDAVPGATTEKTAA